MAIVLLTLFFPYSALAQSAARPDEATATAGIWELEAKVGDRVLEGRAEIREEEAAGGARGLLRLGSLPPAEITSVELDGSTVRLTLTLPEGEARATWELASDSTFEGHLEIGENVVPMSGRRLSSHVKPEIEQPLETLRDRISERAADLLAAHGEAGLAVAVVEGTGARWVGGFGMADRTGERAVTDSTLFQVGSISKTLTAWGILRLVESGRLGLDDPVNSHLKRWKLESDRHEADRVTVRHLLSHTGGVNVPSISGVDLEREVPDLIDELNGRDRGPEWRVRVVDEPGAGFEYSGGGYMVLQLLVEEVTGRDFARYMRSEVLLPLGMQDSRFGWSELVAQRVAMPYSPVAERNRRHRLFAGLAGAGLYTSARDMASFLAAHFLGPDDRPAGRGVVSPSALDSMTRPAPATDRYGLGYEIYPSLGETRIVGHGGSNVGWKANFLLVPGEGFGFAVLSNADRGEARSAVVGMARDLMIRAYGPR